MTFYAALRVLDPSSLAVRGLLAGVTPFSEPYRRSNSLVPAWSGLPCGLGEACSLRNADRASTTASGLLNSFVTVAADLPRTRYVELRRDSASLTRGKVWILVISHLYVPLIYGTEANQDDYMSLQPRPRQITADRRLALFPLRAPAAAQKQATAGQLGPSSIIGP